MPDPIRYRFPPDTLFASALRAIQRHPVKCLSGWSPRFGVLDSGRLQARCSGKELRGHILRAISLGHGWHDETTPSVLLAAAAAVCLANSTKLTLPGISRITQLTGSSLEALDLTNQFVVTDAHIADVTRACPGLRVLSLVGCRKVTGASIESLLMLPRLAFADFGGCFNVAPDDVSQLLRRHKNAAGFTGLGLSGLAGSDLLKDVTKLTGGLTWLSLGYSLASAADLLGAASANPQLAGLFLQWCEGANDILVGDLSSTCPNLYHLDVTGCKGVTNVGILALIPSLQCVASATTLTAIHVDVASPGARKWDLDETEWLDFALRCARAREAETLSSVPTMEKDVDMVGGDDYELQVRSRGRLRILAAKHSGATRAVAEQLNRMGAVLQLLL